MVQAASALLLAAATNRRLLINWKDPHPLTNFLKPARIRHNPTLCAVLVKQALVY